LETTGVAAGGRSDLTVAGFLLVDFLVVEVVFGVVAGMLIPVWGDIQYSNKYIAKYCLNWFLVWISGMIKDDKTIFPDAICN
jgi:hypothetical protein